MASTFQNKLKEIRDAGSRRSEELQKVRSSIGIERSLKTVHGFEYRERVEGVIEELVAGFQEAAIGFELSRGFYEGKYMLALRHVDAHADEKTASTSHGAFSRVIFLLAPHSEDDTFEIQCRKTIRDRDLETLSVTVPMGDESFGRIGEFIEGQFLTFAESYFAESDPSGALTT